MLKYCLAFGMSARKASGAGGHASRRGASSGSGSARWLYAIVGQMVTEGLFWKGQIEMGEWWTERIVAQLTPLRTDSERSDLFSRRYECSVSGAILPVVD